MERGKTSDRSEVCACDSTSPHKKGEVTYLQTLRNHVQKDCVCGISRLLYDVIMLVALDFGCPKSHPESLAHLSASLAPHLT